jgi:hypothetical protein
MTDAHHCWKPFEVFRAVERKDVMYLMEIRDRAFPVCEVSFVLFVHRLIHVLQLLLRKTGNATPLLHAMRIGQSHRDVAIVLLGAFSRWVNHLDGDEIPLPKTRVILKALRNAIFTSLI